MNKIKVILIVLILVPVVSVILPSNSVFNNKLCAAVEVNRGNACIDNTTVCPSGYTVAADYFSGATLTQMRANQVSAAFASTYGQDSLRTMCIRSNFRTIIPVYTATGRVDAGSGGQNIQAISESGSPALDTVRVARACPSGWHADQGNYSLATLGIEITSWREPWGCCPSGYNFINTKNQTFPDGYQVGVCAKSRINGGIPDYLETEGHNAGNGIYDAAGNLLVAFPANDGYSQFSSWADLEAAVGTADFIYSYTTNEGNIVQPVVGQGLGVRFKDLNLDGQEPRVRTGPPPTGATKKCPSNSACAIIGDGNDINAVIPASRLEQAGNADSCSKCFTAGDIIGTSTAASGSTDNPDTDIDESVGFVRYCNADGTFRDETLLGTPDITKGYLLEDSTNKALYDQCFSTGGIYTAIGCIDPTPTGIITGLIRIALGVMGGVALLQMIYVGILYQQGNTEKIKGARTQLIATLTGVAVLVFSVLILRIIGVNVLDVLSVGSV